MSPETRDFLERLRDAEDPTPEDERRVLAAVRVTVAAGALAGAGAGAANFGKALGAWALAGWKPLSMVVCLIAAAGVADTIARDAAPPPVAPALHLPAPGAPSALSATGPATDELGAAAPVAPAPALARIEPPAGAPAAAASSKAARPPSLRDELALMAEVEALLQRGDGDAALRRLDDHDTGDRQLLAEREAARVLALCAAGRGGEARQAASEFLRGHPTSPQRFVVARSCAADEPAEPR